MLLLMTHFKARVGVLPLFTNAELQRLTMPVLLLMGTHDALRDAQKIVSRLQRMAPQLTAIILPGAGHALVNTTVQVLPFLAKTDRP